MFKVVALAMGVAVIVLNMLKIVPVETQVALLGLGLFMLAPTKLA